MRWLSIPFLVMLAAVATPPAAAQTPALKALEGGFRAGLWEARSIGGKGQNSVCLPSSDALLTGGRRHRGCDFTIISDSNSEAVVTYRCRGDLSGRTALRRDAAGIYTLDAQGVENGRPFGRRAEWRRVGSCPAQ